MDAFTTSQYNDSYVTVASQLNDSYVTSTDELPKMRLVFLVVYSVICAVGVLGNFLVLYIMIKMTKVFV